MRTSRLRPGQTDTIPGARSAPRPVLLATLDAPLVAEASQFAVDSAVESGQPLLVVNAVETTLSPCSLGLGYDYIARPEIEKSLRAPAELAHGLGIRVERVCLRSTQPVEALLDFAAERDTGLLVLGPDPSQMPRRRYRRAVRKVRDASPCLLWLASD
ncbi:MAG: universal stress protein [Actinobacteria bacterium]|nr:universal stress protein [Actinomycetota bacterium]